ncbi:charged multivesicular body protein 4b-like isoform X2 [Aphis gossypii]|uniref:charged multivesicular body protein 4b-like isoform X2 n=1 Tax=Aphis gossypii TaxID=80765 RepID=UPI0021594F8F|nr:charged multivesicular body protein 4b-like isoform X2 [Aphis gossypii]
MENILDIPGIVAIPENKMNFLRKFFGGKKKEKKKPLSELDLLQKCRSTEQFLIARREILDKNIKKELATIKANIKINRQVALNALKRKKIYENQLSQIDEILLTVIRQNMLALTYVTTQTQFL